MAINRWDPFRDLVELQEKMLSVFGSSFPREERNYRGKLASSCRCERRRGGGGGGEFVLFVDLPGLDERSGYYRGRRPA